MPPKKGKGRGRGRGIPPGTQGQNAPPGLTTAETHAPSSEQPTPPSGFFTASSSTEKITQGGEPTPSNGKNNFPKGKNNMRTVHPEEIGIELKLKSPASVPALPRRPGVGNLGTRIKLVSNCFPIEVPSGYVFHYDVIVRKINSGSGGTGKNENHEKYRCLHTRTRRKVISVMLETVDCFSGLFAAYDGENNLYTRKQMKANFPFKCEVILPDECPDNPRQNAFAVEIKPVKKEDNSCAISLDTIHAFFERRIPSVPQEAIMAVETILRHGPCLRFTPIGRSFFYPPNPCELNPIGGGLEIWFGYHQSVRLGEWKPLVNLNMTATMFWQEGPVLNYIAEIMETTVDELRRIPVIQDRTIKNISRKLKDKWITVTHLAYPKKCRILELCRKNANDLDFTLTVDGNEETKSIARYFEERYNRILEFPNLPCLRIYPKDKEIYYPVELCNFRPGQHAKTALTPAQKSEMIKFTSLPPKERFQKINEIVTKADFKGDRCVREFDLQVATRPLSLEGRVLDSPSLIYRDERKFDKKIRPMNGSWNLRYTQFLRGAEINEWVLLSFANVNDYYLNEFSKLFLKIGRNLGIKINRPFFIDTVNVDCDEKELFAKVKRKAQLAVIILPTFGESTTYSKIKKVSETVVGLTTQCIREITVRNIVNGKVAGPPIISNLWLKVNAKMGGENTTLIPGEVPAIFKAPVIVIGADVNHPSPSPDGKPKFSLAACVGSLDGNLSRYAVSIKPQSNRNENKKAIEIILDLKNMIVDLLKAFYRYTNHKKPEKIIFYRDGVSEGQLGEVRDHEVKSIREACLSLEGDYKPSITFIVVQKGHHVRFRPEDWRDGAGSTKNIPPGTTVDTTVTHPINFDFFLCSHFGLKGTSRPGHYIVIEDDNDFTANDLQKLTFQLCHLSARCTKSISIPTPVAYAHLVAYRARRHLEVGTEEDTSSVSESSDTVSPLLQEVIEAIKVLDEFKSSMYFV